MSSSLHLLTRSLFIATMVSLILSCHRTEATPQPEAPAGASIIRVGTLDLSARDLSVKPGNDFFAYANGNWLKRTEIPADRASWGQGAMVDEVTAKRTADLIKEAAANKASGSAEAEKVSVLYTTFMDEEGIEKLGFEPLKPTLDRIAAIKDAAGLARYLGESLRADVDVLNATNFYTDNLLGLWVAQDLDDPSHYSPFLLQGGLGLPDRDYYLDASPRMTEIRDKYRAHLRKVIELAHLGTNKDFAESVYTLEHAIAETHGTRVDSEDVQKGNNHWTRADFDRKAPGLDWQAFFAAARLGGEKSFVVWHPTAIIGCAALARKQPLAVWKRYLTVRAIEHVSSVLPRAFVNEHFAFYGTVLHGTPALRERWKRAVDATSDALGEAVGKLYVERYFPPSEKARAEEMVKNLVAAFAHRIDNLTWMAPETKAKAKAKLMALKVGVGYPDKWRDYSGLEIAAGEAMGNLLSAERFEYGRNLKKLGQPVDRSEWVMNPQLVNAVNLPAMNALNFPAAILQPPFFDPTRPAVMDYGATGATIGHEISHSFDDQGAQFDASGRLANWWTEEDFKHFQAAGQALVTQYDAYHPFADAAVNGKLTSSENIADVAGLAAAYDAYRLSTGGEQAPEAQGLTGDQQLFLSYAQSWSNRMREPAMRERLVTDGHAPDEYRADTVRNLDAWYKAFDVRPGDRLFLAPEARVHVW